MVSSIPLAFLGGAITLPSTTYRVLVGVVLLFAAYRLFWYTERERILSQPRCSPPCCLALGLDSLGVTGIGGGIFLSPLLLFMGWASFKETAGTSSAFILLNSIAGLAGHVSSVQALPPAALAWAMAAVVGGRSALRSNRRLAEVDLRRLFGCGACIAGVR